MKLQNVKNALQPLLLKLRPRSPKGPSNDESSLIAPVQVLAVEKHQFVFGLDWRFYTDRKDLNLTFSAAKKEGYTHHILTQSEDLVGIGRVAEKKSKGKLNSASLQLIQTVSQGGVELFVFQLDRESYCLLAFNDSRPVNGYEKIGSRTEIMALAGDFQLSQVGQNIRQAGNTGALEHEENIKLSEAFGRLDEITRLKKIPDYKKLAFILFGILLLGSAAYFLNNYYGNIKMKESLAKMANERDPNFIYEREINSSMQNIGLPAHIQLERWLSVINPVPMLRRGWSLSGIHCLPNECKLNWKRHHGNFEEFYLNPLSNEINNIENQSANNPATGVIETTIKVAESESSGVTWTREKLFPLQSIQRPLASQLQDISLLSNSAVSLGKAELYPSKNGLSVQQVNKPVVSAEWMITHDLWSLSELSFTAQSLVVESLNIVRGDNKDQWIYTLKGRFYAKGKEY
jgi:hypothetical protein